MPSMRLGNIELNAPKPMDGRRWFVGVKSIETSLDQRTIRIICQNLVEENWAYLIRPWMRIRLPNPGEVFEPLIAKYQFEGVIEFSRVVIESSVCLPDWTIEVWGRIEDGKIPG